jgi:hypothetical protein
MNQSGSGLLIAILAVVGILLVAAALLFYPAVSASAGGTPGVTAARVSASLARNPGGVNALVTINAGSEEIRSFDLTRLVIPGMGGGPLMPYAVGPVRAGGSVTVTIPFRGPAPAPNALMSLQIEYQYRTRWFGKGAGSSGVTSVLP